MRGGANGFRSSQGRPSGTTSLMVLRRMGRRACIQARTPQMRLWCWSLQFSVLGRWFLTRDADALSQWQHEAATLHIVHTVLESVLVLLSRTGTEGWVHFHIKAVSWLSGQDVAMLQWKEKGCIWRCPVSQYWLFVLECGLSTVRCDCYCCSNNYMYPSTTPSTTGSFLASMGYVAQTPGPWYT